MKGRDALEGKITEVATGKDLYNGVPGKAGDHPKQDPVRKREDRRTRAFWREEERTHEGPDLPKRGKKKGNPYHFYHWTRRLPREAPYLQRRKSINLRTRPRAPLSKRKRTLLISLRDTATRRLEVSTPRESGTSSRQKDGARFYLVLSGGRMSYLRSYLLEKGGQSASLERGLQDGGSTVTTQGRGIDL